MEDLSGLEFENLTPKDPVLFDREENDLVTSLTNKKIQDILTAHGYPENKLRTIFEGQRCSTKEQCELNWTLKKIKKDHNLLLRDVFLYFDTFTTIEKILTFIDADTIGVLKTELADEYNRKLVRNDLFKCKTIRRT